MTGFDRAQADYDSAVPDYLEDGWLSCPRCGETVDELDDADLCAVCVEAVALGDEL